MRSWMEIAAQACERTRIECGHLPFAEQCAFCERESVNVSLSNLLTFPFIKQEIARKALELHGWCARCAAVSSGACVCVVVTPALLDRAIVGGSPAVAATAGSRIAGCAFRSCPQVLRP